MSSTIIAGKTEKKIRVSIVPFARKTNKCLMDHRYQNSLRWVNKCPLKNWKAIRWFYLSLSVSTQLRVLHWIHFLFYLNLFWFRNSVSWSSREAKCNFNVVTLASQLTYSRLSKTWQIRCRGLAEIVKENLTWDNRIKMNYPFTWTSSKNNHKEIPFIGTSNITYTSACL